MMTRPTGMPIFSPNSFLESLASEVELDLASKMVGPVRTEESSKTRKKVRLAVEAPFRRESVILMTRAPWVLGAVRPSRGVVEAVLLAGLENWEISIVVVELGGNREVSHVTVDKMRLAWEDITRSIGYHTLFLRASHDHFSSVGHAEWISDKFGRVCPVDMALIWIVGRVEGISCDCRGGSCGRGQKSYLRAVAGKSGIGSWSSSRFRRRLFRRACSLFWGRRRRNDGA